jgi:hypothetical protein
VTSESLVVAVVFAVLVGAVVIVGIRLGMLMAPRIDRLSATDDEDDRADD